MDYEKAQENMRESLRNEELTAEGLPSGVEREEKSFSFDAEKIYITDKRIPLETLLRPLRQGTISSPLIQRGKISGGRAESSYHFEPGVAVPPPRVSPFSTLKRSRVGTPYQELFFRGPYAEKQNVPSWYKNVSLCLPVCRARVLGKKGRLRRNRGNAFPRFAAERPGPFCRKRRPRRAGAGRARCDEGTGVDSKAKGFLPPQKK